MTRSRKVFLIAGLAAVAAVITFFVATIVKNSTAPAAVSSTSSTGAAHPTRETVTMPALPPVTVTLPAATVTVTAAPPAVDTHTLSAGLYKVGDVIPAGQYKTTGADSCYWARLKNDSGDLGAIIANNNLTGPGSVTVKPGEYFEISGTCTWTAAK